MRVLKFLLIAALAACCLPLPAAAVPARIVILRHGEKQNAYALCPTGTLRSQALAAYYLGENARESLFDANGPAAFFAITVHTIELASPAAASWKRPLIVYAVVPSAFSVAALNERTREAAREVLTDPRWNGKTVVLVWEHHHIADAALERKYGNVTLRSLLHLNALGNAVPTTWNGSNYDYFWIVEYGKPGSATPTRFRAVKQVFPAPYAAVPHNDWGAPENLPSNNHCL